MSKDKQPKLNNAVYEAELLRLQLELVKMQEWVKATGQRLVVIFEGRDAAGKGGSIKRITQYLNPRVARVVALPAPTERERTEWYFQRYIPHLPAAGEITLFDRSWYNRAGVERVMGFCTPEEHRRFLHQAPIFERLLVEDGVLVRKYWFSVSDTEQEKRFKSRLKDPMRRWKLSPMDLESISRWEEYSRAKDEMMVHTDIPEAPWFVVESDDKKRARLNMISHLLSVIPYETTEQPDLKLPKRPPSTGYQRTPRSLQNEVPDHSSTLEVPGPKGAAAVAKQKAEQAAGSKNGSSGNGKPAPAKSTPAKSTPAKSTASKSPATKSTPAKKTAAKKAASASKQATADPLPSAQQIPTATPSAG